MTAPTSNAIDVIAALVRQLDRPAAFLKCDGTLVTCNAAMAKGLGVTVADLLYRPIDTLLEAGTVRRDLQNARGPIDATLTILERNIAVSFKPMPLPGVPGGMLCQERVVPETVETPTPFFMENLDQGVWEYAPQTGVLQASQTFRNMRGLPPDAPVQNPDQDWMDEVHPDDRDELRSELGKLHSGEIETINIQYRRLHTAGHWIWVLCRGRIIDRDADGSPTRVVGTDTDITEIKQIEAELEQQSSKLQLAIETAKIGIWEFDAESVTVLWDDRMLEIYGVSDRQNLRSGDDWSNHLHPDDREETLEYADKCQRENVNFAQDYRIVRPDGSVRNVRSMASQVTTSSGTRKLIGVNIDITDHIQRAAELEDARRELEYESRHDALTGLANRRLLDETIEGLFADLGSGDGYAVLQLDLDHFKRINDTYGHAAGDAVLKQVAKRLRGLVSKDALIARSGGDEFVVLFPTAPSLAQLEQIAQTIVAAMQPPVTYLGIKCDIGVSVGLALGVGPPKNKSEIFINADLALYEAKKAGRSCYRTYSDAYRIDSDLRLQ